MDLELTDASAEIISSLRETLSAAEVFQNKIILPGGNSAQIAAEDDFGVRIGDGNVNTAPSTHIKVGGPHAFRIFGGPPSYIWTFDRDRTVTFPDGGSLRFKGSAPTTSIGSTGDVAGMIAFDNNFFYRCIGSFNGTSHIWKRIPFSDSTW